ADAPDGARDLLSPLEDLASPDVGTLREHVLAQLSTGAYVL
ncbi:MAG: hypothetical protein K0S10_685, partial [Rubrobacteraceae bacterium]|nr:hypothetical protein [Rubrobacteraceae bacterium]